MKRKDDCKAVFEKMLNSFQVRDAIQMYKMLLSPVTLSEIQVPDDIGQPRTGGHSHAAPMAVKMDKRSQETNLAICIKF